MVFREELHSAATKFDGHVTNGSLEAQVQVVQNYLEEIFKSLIGELKTAGDFGLFRDHECIKDEYLETLPLPEYIAIEVLKKAREKYVKL